MPRPVLRSTPIMALINKRYKTLKEQSKMDNPEKLATQGTQNEEKQNEKTICVGHHYAQKKTTNNAQIWIRT
jgi:hypothetical protein